MELILSILLALFLPVLSIAALPVFYGIFRRLGWMAYVMSGMLVWVIVSGIYFSLGHFVGLGFTWYALIIPTVLGMAYAWKLAGKQLWDQIEWKKVLAILLVEVVSFGIMLYIKSYSNLVFSVDRPMEIGILQSLSRAHHLPLQDFWMSGMTFNYYYFGHFLIYTVGKIIPLDYLNGFFIYSAWSFSVVAMLVFALGASLYELVTKKIRFAWLAGLVTTVITLYSYTIFGVIQLVSRLQAGGFDINKQLGDTLADALFQYGGLRLFMSVMPSPFKDFIDSDLHAIIFSFFLIPMILYTLHCMVQKYTTRLHVVVLILLALLFATNAWSVMQMGLVYLWVLVRVYSVQSIPLKKIVTSFASGIIASLAMILPWFLSYKAPIGGIGISTLPHNIGIWLVGFGFFIVVYGVFFTIKKRANFDKEQLQVIAASSLITVAMVVFAEVFYFRDYFEGSSRERFNTIYKVFEQGWFVLALYSGVLIINIKQHLSGIKLIVLSSLLAAIIIPQLLHSFLFAYDNIKPYSMHSITDMYHDIESRYPGEAQSMLFLRDIIKPDLQPQYSIVEAEGESYNWNNLYSTMLGVPSVIGYPEHEWSWRGNSSEIFTRRNEVLDFYTGTSFERKQAFLAKYKVKFVIIGGVEKTRYGNLLKEEAIQSAVGNVMYDKGGVKILQVLDWDSKFGN
jgi:uncharacterized membrane protein